MARRYVKNWDPWQTSLDEWLVHEEEAKKDEVDDYPDLDELLESLEGNGDE